MPLEISRNDIRNIKVDAIVNPTDNYLSGSGGTDSLIHEMAGKQLDDFCNSITYLEKGEAIISSCFDCENCKYIIHTCGPIYCDGNDNEEEVLKSCYRNSLQLAKVNDLESIAFPLISSGTFMFPKGKALKIATDTIIEFLLENEMFVYLLVYDKQAFDSANKLYADIKDYLGDNYIQEQESNRKSNNILSNIKNISYSKLDNCSSHEKNYEYIDSLSADNYTFEPDESFSECLIRMIDERGMLDPDVYKRANIDRKHFNHIKNNKLYRPKKETAVALAIGMKLDLDETNVLLERAGFVLSNSSKFDLIIKYCIENNIYNIYQINEILFEEDQKTLGC